MAGGEGSGVGGAPTQGQAPLPAARPCSPTPATTRQLPPPTTPPTLPTINQVYFERWWRDQDDGTRAAVQALAKSGALSFAGGGWVSPDEATTHYADVLDAYALGHAWLWDTLGVVPSVGWQIDTFGHSAAHAHLLSSAAAFDALLFSRIDSVDRELREGKRQLEFVWDTAPGRARSADLFCYAFHRGGYEVPSEFAPLHRDATLEDDPDGPLGPGLVPKAQGPVANLSAAWATVRGRVGGGREMVVVVGAG